MNQSTRSYLKVPYDLRPAKQVERRMFIETMQKLSEAGFNIPQYQYTGFGSTFFVDFILFHKLLGIKSMWSIEKDIKIEKRVKFNKPFSFVKIYMNDVSTIIPSLSQNKQHILWLDFDEVINEEITEAIRLAATYLTKGSLLIVTVDLSNIWKKHKNTNEVRNYFFNEVGVYLGKNKKKSDFSQLKIPSVHIEILRGAIQKGLLGKELDLYPLFNFIYKDRAEMLTFGGLIGSDVEHQKILNCNIKKLFYIRSDWLDESYKINVPNLTRKERQYLDSNMPCPPSWKLKKFELPQADIDAYKEIYRYMPLYAELLI